MKILGTFDNRIEGTLKQVVQNEAGIQFLREEDDRWYPSFEPCTGWTPDTILKLLYYSFGIPKEDLVKAALNL